MGKILLRTNDENMTQKILILAANPKNSFTLEIPREIREILEGLQRSRYREQFEVEERLAVRPQDLRRAILEVQPHIVHFCGHGTGSQGLVLENDRGREHLVSTQALSNLFKLFAEQVECVVLNACYSQVQAEAISQHINYVIGMRQEIIDQAAIAFSVGFYDALGAGRDIQFAYNLGRNAIQLEISQPGNSRKANPVITGNQLPLLPAHLIPVLLIKETIPITEQLARYALVIGVNKYQNQQFKSLPQAVHNAETVAQLLATDGNFQVENLSSNFSKETIWQALKTLLWERSENAYALVYFAGYGLRLIDELEEEKGFLVPSDCQAEMLGEKIVEAHQGISLANLNRLIEKSPAKCLIMILDCCHRGSFLPQQLLQQSLSAFTMQKDYFLLAAGTNETPLPITNNRHSFFTNALLKGLSIENAGSEGQITGKRLSKYITQKLANAGQDVVYLGGGSNIPIVTHLQTQPTPTVKFNHDNPYLGLHAFSPQQKQYFHGRDRAIRALLDRLSQSRFLAVLGASGCGKSSLVKAGVLPRFQQEQILGSHQWYIESFTPGNYPLEIINDKLDSLHSVSLNQPFVLFIDQFEEVFTLCKDDKERCAFFRLLAAEVNSSEHQGRFIVALRSDFLDRCAKYTPIADLINSTTSISNYLVEPLDIPELTAAIQEPAKLHGVSFEAGLVESMVEDVISQPGALPLLQYALRELWRVCIEKPESPQPLLNWRGYQKIGRVGGALNNQATRLYNSFASEVDKNFVRWLFLELVELGEGETVTRRRVTRESLAARADSDEQLEEVLGRLVQKRLIVVTSVGNGESLLNYVEVTHEALLTQWELLQHWIEDNRESLRIERRFEADFLEWRDRYKQADEALLSGVRLTAVEEWYQEFQPRLSKEEEEFIRGSIRRREKETQEKLEKERKLRELAEFRIKVQRWIISLLLVMGFSVTVLFAFLIQAKGKQVELAKEGEIKTLIATAETFFDSNKQLEAMITSVQALKILKETNLEKEKFLEELQPIISEVREYNRLESHQEKVLGVSVSPDGNNIISASGDETVKIWNWKGELLNNQSEHEDQVWVVRYSHQNNLFASSGFDKKIIVWHIEENNLKTMSLTGHMQRVYDLSFSANDKFIASSSKDGTVRIWDLQTGKEIKKQEEGKEGSSYRIYGVDFHPNKQEIVAYTGNGNGIKIWNWRSKYPPILIGKHNNLPLLVRFNSKGSMLVSCDDQGSIKLWEIDNSKKIIGEIQGHSQAVYGIEFSPDGKKLASASLDGTIKIWNIDEVRKSFQDNREAVKKSRETLKGHISAVNRIEFSPDSNFLISSSNDKTIKIWNLQDRFNPGRKLQLQYFLDYSCRFLDNYLSSNKNLDTKEKEICH